MTEIDPKAEGAGCRIGIAAARFNTEITDMLLSGCRRALSTCGVAADDVELVRVPGAWELPLACRVLIDTGRFDAVIALGAVIRGETAHFEFISNECARGLQQLGLETGIPVTFGVLTPENGDQARRRADPERDDKGGEVARAALEMVALKRAVAAMETERG